jgi:hypothetical protein
MLENLGQPFEDQQDMNAQAANFANCSSPTAGRWIYQLTRKNEQFDILEQEHCIVIIKRPTHEDLK